MRTRKIPRLISGDQLAFAIADLTAPPICVRRRPTTSLRWNLRANSACRLGTSGSSREDHNWIVTSSGRRIPRPDRRYGGIEIRSSFQEGRC